MRPNFVVAGNGEAKILRKPKVVNSPDARGRGAERRWLSKVYKRLAAAKSIEEVMRIHEEVQLALITRPWEK